MLLISFQFGKHIQSHQVPGWSAYYLDYKFLKKIISSLAANRPASEAAALALGLRPWNQPSAPGEQFSASLEEDLGHPPIFSESGLDEDRSLDFRAHKAAFFFKLERELEKVRDGHLPSMLMLILASKINAFYLQKEAELQLRLETLLSKRRAAAMRGLRMQSTIPPRLTLNGALSRKVSDFSSVTLGTAGRDHATSS